MTDSNGGSQSVLDYVHVPLAESVDQRTMRKYFLAKKGHDSCWKSRVAWRFNLGVIMSWVMFVIFTMSQPWVGHWINNEYYDYSADFTVYAKNGSIDRTYRHSGLCTVPASEFYCTDGQNFTELALKYRKEAIGCGCGQGIYGESLCPMTSYGYTLSDFVSTPPAIACMLGLSFGPIMGTWVLTFLVNEHTNPSPFAAIWHFRTMAIFQLSYVWWGVVSDCIFPVAHSVLTVAFIAALVIHWKITACLVIAKWGFDDREAKIVFTVATSAALSMILGSIPRLFLVLNDLSESKPFPNLVFNDALFGIGTWAFWLGEAVSLSLTFGAYPILVIDIFCFHEEKLWFLGISGKYGGKEE